MRLFDQIKKPISGIVIFFFAAMCVFEHAPRLAYASSREQGEPSAEKNLSDLGSTSSKLPQLYYIQDAHNSLEAQEDISKIIHRLVKEKGVKTVYVEGYDGDDLSGVLDKLYPFSDKLIKETVSHFFLDYLRLSGAQYSFINRDTDFKLIGIENFQDYLDNLKENSWSPLHQVFAVISSSGLPSNGPFGTQCC